MAQGKQIWFDTVHLRYAPPQFSHLTGMIEVFKSKVVSMSVGSHTDSVILYSQKFLWEEYFAIWVEEACLRVNVFLGIVSCYLKQP